MALGQKRWWVVTAVALVVVVWVLIYGREARLDMAYEGPTERVRPGEVVPIRSTDGGCVGGFSRIYEPYVLGMWRQTHPQRSPWWAPGPSGAAFSTLACSIGPEGTVQVPDDVTADRIALCDTDRKCIELRIDHSG